MVDLVKPYQVDSLEKLDPPTTCAGQTAALARVRWYYAIDSETGDIYETAKAVITILWDKSVADLTKAAEAQKIAAAARATEVAKQQDDVLAVLKDVKDVGAVADPVGP